MSSKKRNKHHENGMNQINLKRLTKINYSVLLLFSVVFIYLCLQINHIQDDAFITFRYVNNFIHGNGLVFNIGERVEGFTSILWVFILSAMSILKFNITEISQYISIASGVLTLFITYKITEKTLGTSFSATNSTFKEGYNLDNYVKRLFYCIPSIMLVFTGAFHYWSVSGMEETFFILLNLSAIYFYILNVDKPHFNIPFSIYMLLAILVRPEGAIMFAVILAHHLINSYKHIEGKTTKAYLKKIFSKNNLTVFGIIIIPNVLVLLFRLLYYGYPLPNTFYAKTGISSIYFNAGLEYFYDFLKTYLLFGFILLAPIVLFKLRSNSHLSLFYSLIVLNIIYTIFIGGDVLPFFRFFLPILPLIYILFTEFLFVTYFIIKPRVSNKFSFITVIVFFCFIGFICYFNYSTKSEEIERFSTLENELVSKMIATADWLNKQQQITKKPFTVAATTIGALSYYSNATIIDMLGLTDEIIAHEPKYIEEISGVHAGWKERKYNVDYILSRKPDYIYFSTGIKPSAYAERALFVKEEFIGSYYPYYFFLISNARYIETIYKRMSDEDLNIQKFSDNPKYSDNYVHLYNRALNHNSKTKGLDKIIEVCKILIEQSPLNFGDSYRLLGQFYALKGEDTKSIESFKKACEREKTNGPSNIALMLHYRKLRDSVNFAKHYMILKNYNPTVLKLYGVR